jgi:hypothetical protein
MHVPIKGNAHPPYYGLPPDHPALHPIFADDIWPAVCPLIRLRL